MLGTRTLSWGIGAILMLVVGLPATAAAGPAVPDGFTMRSQVELGTGVVHTVLVREDPAQLVHVATLQPGAPFTLRAVLSNDSVAGPAPRLERTSSMCARARCLAAVNGDFFHPDGRPVGGVVSLGEVMRTPVDVHHQLVVEPDGRLAAGTVNWTGRLMPTDLRRLDLTGVNSPRGPNDLILYTPAAGPSTMTNEHGVEIALEMVQPAGPVRSGQTLLVRLAGYVHGQGDTPIPPGGAVLSGHGAGAAALADLWSRVQSGTAGPQALLRVETAPTAVESVGGSPILLRNGARWFGDAATSFVRGRHPRTAVGWNPAGETFLVTVDGRQPGYSAGMTLAELTDLMAGLGATDAINMDGGGSTTFVTGGEVANRPSDQVVKRSGKTTVVAQPRAGEQVVGNVERPVVVALVIVPRTVGPLHPADPLAVPDLTLPQALAIPPDARVADPASAPHAALPALVALPPGAPDEGPGKALPTIAALVLLVSAGALSVRRTASLR